MARNNTSTEDWVTAITHALTYSSINITLNNLDQLTWRQLCTEVAGIDMATNDPIQQQILALADTTLPSLFPNDATHESKEVITAEALFNTVTSIATKAHKIIDEPSHTQTQYHAYFEANHALWLEGLNSSLFTKLSKNESKLKQLPSKHFGPSQLHPPIQDNTSLCHSLLMAFLAYTFAIADFSKIKQIKTSFVKKLFLKTIKANSVTSKKKCLNILIRCKQFINQPQPSTKPMDDQFSNISLMLESEAGDPESKHDCNNDHEVETKLDTRSHTPNRQNRQNRQKTTLSIRQQIARAAREATLECNDIDYQEIIESKETNSMQGLLGDKLNEIEKYLEKRQTESRRFYFFHPAQDYTNRHNSFEQIKTMLLNTSDYREAISTINIYHIPQFYGRTCCSSRRYQGHLQDLVTLLDKALADNVPIEKLMNTNPNSEPDQIKSTPKRRYSL